jgi:hypothetical protein
VEGVPEALRARVLDAVKRETGHGTRGLSVHERLRNAADHLLAEVLTAMPSRGQALTLLAADALMTFACEAEVERAVRENVKGET